MGEANRAVLYAINRWPEAFSPFFRFFSEATNYLWFKGLLLAMVIGMVLAKGRARTTALSALIAFPIANGITDLFKHGIPEPRPFQELTDVVLRVGASNSYGTASAHSANMAAVACVFCLRLGWWGAPWAVAAVLTGLSRVYVGAHYPYQVLLGWTCGIVAGLLVTKTWDAIARRRSGVETPQDPNAVANV